MVKIKSVVLNKTRTQNGYLVEFYNPWWGRFVVNYKYNVFTYDLNNALKLMRVGDYFLVKGIPLEPNPEIKEYKIVKYMVKATEKVRKEQRELAIPNMNVMEINALADAILRKINELTK